MDFVLEIPISSSAAHKKNEIRYLIATVQAPVAQSGPRSRFGATPLVLCPFAFQPNHASVHCVAEQTFRELNDDGDARDDAWQKMDLNFTLEFHKQLNPFRAQICLKACQRSKFLKEIQNICRRGLGSQKYATLCHFTLLFCRERQRNVERFITHLHIYCSAH